MNTINLSKKAYERLERLQIPNEVLNTEAKVFNYYHHGQRKVFKSFYITEGESFASKLYTVQMLHESAAYLPETLCIPDYLVSVKGYAVGFTVPYVEGINLSTVLQSGEVSIEERIYYLKQVGIILEQLKNIRKYTDLNDFYINDLHDSNFIVNPKKRSVKVIDLDSSKIGNNIAFPSRYIRKTPLITSFIGSKYEENLPDKNGRVHGTGYLIANENSDIYCYCMMILNYLMGADCHKMDFNEFYNYLDYLKHIGVDKELLEVLAILGQPKNNENPVNYLDSLTTEQIYRAKKLVYQQTRQRICK